MTSGSDAKYACSVRTATQSTPEKRPENKDDLASEINTEDETKLPGANETNDISRNSRTEKLNPAEETKGPDNVCRTAQSATFHSATIEGLAANGHTSNQGDSSAQYVSKTAANSAEDKPDTSTTTLVSNGQNRGWYNVVRDWQSSGNRSCSDIPSSLVEETYSKSALEQGNCQRGATKRTEVKQKESQAGTGILDSRVMPKRAIGEKQPSSMRRNSHTDMQETSAIEGSKNDERTAAGASGNEQASGIKLAGKDEETRKRGDVAECSGPEKPKKGNNKQLECVIEISKQEVQSTQVGDGGQAVTAGTVGQQERKRGNKTKPSVKPGDNDRTNVAENTGRIKQEETEKVKLAVERRPERTALNRDEKQTGGDKTNKDNIKRATDVKELNRAPAGVRESQKQVPVAPRSAAEKIKPAEERRPEEGAVKRDRKQKDGEETEKFETKCAENVKEKQNIGMTTRAREGTRETTTAPKSSQMLPKPNNQLDSLQSKQQQVTINCQPVKMAAKTTRPPSLQQIPETNYGGTLADGGQGNDDESTNRPGGQVLEPSLSIANRVNVNTLKLNPAGTEPGWQAHTGKHSQQLSLPVPNKPMESKNELTNEMNGSSIHPAICTRKPFSKTAASPAANTSDVDNGVKANQSNVKSSPKLSATTGSSPEPQTSAPKPQRTTGQPVSVQGPSGTSQGVRAPVCAKNVKVPTRSDPKYPQQLPDKTEAVESGTKRGHIFNALPSVPVKPENTSQGNSLRTKDVAMPGLEAVHFEHSMQIKEQSTLSKMNPKSHSNSSPHTNASEAVCPNSGQSVQQSDTADKSKFQFHRKSKDLTSGEGFSPPFNGTKRKSVDNSNGDKGKLERNNKATKVTANKSKQENENSAVCTLNAKNRKGSAGLILSSPFILNDENPKLVYNRPQKRRESDARSTESTIQIDNGNARQKRSEINKSRRNSAVQITQSDILENAVRSLKSLKKSVARSRDKTDQRLENGGMVPDKKTRYFGARSKKGIASISADNMSSASKSKSRDSRRRPRVTSQKQDSIANSSRSTSCTCSSSCSSSRSDSDEAEEELSPLELAQQKIRKEKEEEEAKKIAKFRQRGQKAKLKMERLKMEDDPVKYMENPANHKFAFMIRQDELMNRWKKEEEERERKEQMLMDKMNHNSSLATVDGSLSGEGVGDIIDHDDEPFDRRLGPLGGPKPKFKRYSIDDFQLLRVLGTGAFGKVMLAKMKDTRNYFAVKSLRKDMVIDDDDVEDILTERKVLGLATVHPYLCHLFCTFQTPSHLFFVLEFLNGGDLSFHLKEMGRFSTELARFYASELVCGLKFLHRKGIIYRDLKLDNVLLDHEGHVRIADFGMCKMQIFLDRTVDSCCGTVDYMAPEVVCRQNYRQSVDWWSFGIMLYEMLVGLTPFIGLDEDELFWAIRTEQPFYPRFLTPDSTEIIKWLLVKDPELRLGSQGCPAGGVSSQAFFRHVDWIAVERKQVDPPFRPQLRTMADCRYFDSHYTDLPARLTPISEEVLTEIDQERFAGFDYTNPNITD